MESSSPLSGISHETKSSARRGDAESLPHPRPKGRSPSSEEEQSPVWEGGGSKTDLGTCHVTSRSRVTSRQSTPRGRQETAQPPAADVP